MAFDHLAFRARYRAGISPRYSGVLHMLVVAATGLAVMLAAGLHLQQVKAWEWLLLPAALVLVNFAEYAAHRWLGHRKTRIGRLFYSRHTGDHHSFFIADDLPYQSTRDWRVVLFPAWLIYVFLLGLIVPGGWLLLMLVSANAACLFAIGGIGGYLFYEVMHFSYHLPAGSFVERTPIWWRLRRLHQIHHERERMAECNFNITLPLFDWLLGTLVWSPEPGR
ncbi:sterol desaturase family protein [Thalassolituus sp. LLYu03]|uniref:sterol desaturase family protein n=1 Tax=Thalassolituus sp. LLYu03 TaxID=3421656 RepID=UPI003D2C3D8B